MIDYKNSIAEKNFIESLQIIEINPTHVQQWIQNESLSELPTISSRNYFKDKYGFNKHTDNLIPSDSYLILSCLKLSLFLKDLKTLYKDDIKSLNMNFGEFDTVHNFLYDIVLQTQEVLPDNFEKIQKDYYEVLCLAINNDLQLKLNWNLVVQSF